MAKLNEVALKQSDLDRGYRVGDKAKYEAARAAGKVYKLADQQHLYVLCQPNSKTRAWYLAYTSPVDGRERALNLEKYQASLKLDFPPEIGLARARELRDQAKALVRGGVDPILKMKADDEAKKAAEVTAAEQAKADELGRFGRVASDWLSDNESRWSAEYHAKAKALLSRYVIDDPKVGAMLMRDVTTPFLFNMLHAIAVRTHGANRDAGERKDSGSPHGAFHLCGLISSVFDYAVIKGRAPVKPFEGRGLKRQLTKVAGKLIVRNNAALGEPELRELLHKLRTYNGARQTVVGMLLLLHTAVRTSELLMADWPEFDLDAGLWSIPKSRMKMGRAHVVPLSSQVVTLLRELQLIATPRPDGTGMLFPNSRTSGTHMSKNTLNRAFARMGFNDSTWMRGHGARGTFSSIAHERDFGEHADIELALAHVNRHGQISAIYDKSARIEQRRTLMQKWSDHLSSLENNVIPINAASAAAA